MNNDKIKAAYAIIHELDKNIDKEKVKRLFISLEGENDFLLKFQGGENITIDDINDILKMCNEKELKKLNMKIDNVRNNSYVTKEYMLELYIDDKNLDKNADVLSNGELISIIGNNNPVFKRKIMFGVNRNLDYDYDDISYYFGVYDAIAILYRKLLDMRIESILKDSYYKRIEKTKNYNKVSPFYYKYNGKTYNRYNDNFRINKNAHELIASEMLNRIKDIRRYERNTLIY